jgi:acyl transferase domain-containing protein
MAEVEPETISYIEAHGTGTALGDPIEISALTQAFSAGTENKNFCAIASVKPNIGHLDAAAGVAGLIKTILA